MQLTVSPADLHTAAAAIDGSAHRIELARERFTAVSADAVPALGPRAAAAAATGSKAAAAATEVVVDDIRQLASALRALAQLYDRLDATAVPR